VSYLNNNNGENLETPTASPAGTITTEPKEPVNPQGAVVTESPEEVKFNSLKGGTQQRIKDIIAEKDRMEAELERTKQLVSSQPQGFTQPPQPDLSSPQVKDAVAQLDKVGVATKDWADQQINQRLGQLIYNIEVKNLEEKLDGTDGMPKFDRVEYQDFVQRNPKYNNYDPQDVYNIMYSEEIMDAKLKSRGVQPTQPSSSLRPNKTTVREEQWTPESIEARLRESDGPTWYTQNKDLVNKVLQSQLPQ
jgi:hypothetical protein